MSDGARSSRNVPPTAAELGHYHSCWYPVALSSDLGAEQLIGVDFLGGRVVVYRTQAGIAHVRSAYCRHLGADLAVGTVVGERLRCAFHLWEYGSDGGCAFIPAGDKPPPAARLFAFPTTESLGIIWAFNGAVPTYDVPNFGIDEAALQFDAFRNPLAMQVASPIVFLNSFDIQHFRAVHGLAIEADPRDMRRDGDILHYRAHVVAEEFGEIVQERTLWGVNSVTVESLRAGRKLLLLHSLCAVSPDLTQGFLVNATTREGPADAASAEQVLGEARAYSLRLVNEDSAIFDTIRFKADCLTKSDRMLRFGMDYIASFPPASPAADLIG